MDEQTMTPQQVLESLHWSDILVLANWAQMLAEESFDLLEEDDWKLIEKFKLLNVD